MTEKLEREKMANAITNVFENPEVVKMIAFYASKDKKRNNDYGKYIGRVIYYLVTTRNSNINLKVLKRILESEKTHMYSDKFPAGEVIVKDLAQKLVKNNKKPTAENILNLAKQNYIDNGYYMHATHFSNVEGIQKTGFDMSFNRENAAKEFLTGLIDYEYNYKASKLHVTSMYSVLFNYGVYSPEWLYCIVGDGKAVRERNADEAYKKILENASHRITEQRLGELHKYAKQVVNQYFIGDNRYGVVLFDRHAKNENGRRVFNKYEEEDFNNDAFDYENVKERFDVKLDDEKSVLKDEKNFKFAKIAIEYLVERGSIYELKTLDKVKPGTFSVSVMPSYKQYQKSLQQEKESKNTSQNQRSM